MSTHWTQTLKWGGGGTEKHFICGTLAINLRILMISTNLKSSYIHWHQLRTKVLGPEGQLCKVLLHDIAFLIRLFFTKVGFLMYLAYIDKIRICGSFVLLLKGGIIPVKRNQKDNSDKRLKPQKNDFGMNE